MSTLSNLPTLKLCKGYAASAGTVGIDAKASFIVEAGEAWDGSQYVSVIGSKEDFALETRRRIAKRMISLWEEFAS